MVKLDSKYRNQTITGTRDWGHIVMEDKVSILDLDIDILAQKQLTEKIMQQLQKNTIGTSIYVTTKMLERTLEEDTYREILNEFDMLLPGEDEVFSNSNFDILKSQNIETNCNSLLTLLQYFAEEKKSIYLVGNQLKYMEHFFYYCEVHFPKLLVSGCFYKEESTIDANIINDMNVVYPDVVLVALPSPVQEKWIKENKDKVSAKLCVGIGSVLPFLLESYEASRNRNIIVKAIRKICKIWRQFFHKRIFRLELHYYGQKKRKHKVSSVKK